MQNKDESKYVEEREESDKFVPSVFRKHLQATTLPVPPELPGISVLQGIFN